MSWYDPDREDNRIYSVVVNHEEQYSIWPANRQNPLGWSNVGKTGAKAECLEYIKQVWTDMRPLSLRKRMEEMAKNPPAPAPAFVPDPGEEKSLVDRLCEGDHPAVAGVRPERTVKLFREAIERNYVHIKFTDTQGGTELGFKLDRTACDFSKADFDKGTGMVHLEGGLTLDYVKVRCIAEINLPRLEGSGHLCKEEYHERP